MGKILIFNGILRAFFCFMANILIFQMRMINKLELKKFRIIHQFIQNKEFHS